MEGFVFKVYSELFVIEEAVELSENYRELIASAR